MYNVEICLTSKSNLETAYFKAYNVNIRNVSILFDRCRLNISQRFFDSGDFTIRDFLRILLSCDNLCKFDEFIESQPSNSVYYNVSSVQLV